MKGNLQPPPTHEPTAGKASAPQGEVSPCGAPGAYHELSAQEFNARKNLAVVVLKDQSVLEEFIGFSAVHFLPSSKDFPIVLPDWPCERPIGLVCPDGACSSRLAVRLSRLGYTVYHLSGGLHEWHQCTLG